MSLTFLVRSGIRKEHFTARRVKHLCLFSSLMSRKFSRQTMLVDE